MSHPRVVLILIPLLIFSTQGAFFSRYSPRQKLRCCCCYIPTKCRTAACCALSLSLSLFSALSLSLSILRPLSRSQSLCLSASLSPHSPPLYPRDSTRFSGAWNQSHPILTTPKYFCTCAFTQVVQQYIAVTNTTHLLGLLISSSSPRPP